MTPGDADFRKSPMKMIYRKLSKTASLPVTCHPQPLPFVCDNTKALSERFTETNSKVIAEWGQLRGLDAEARSKVLPVAFTARMTAIEKMWL